MPHLTIEYSANLEEAVDLPRLVETVHRAALASGVFPLGGIRVRAARREMYLVADGHPDNAFIHVTARIGHGRDLATKKRAGEEIFAALCAALDPVFATRPLGISFEIQEIDRDLNFKKNNLHDYVAARRKQSEAQPADA